MTVSSKKRWQDLYAESNPFELPQAVSSRLKDCVGKHVIARPASLKYVWLYMHEEDLFPNRGGARGNRMLGLEEWLNVVDESAALGADTLVISAGTSREKRAQLWDICRWAQDVYGMNVAIHIYRHLLADSEIRATRELDQQRTHLLIGPALSDQTMLLRASGVAFHPIRRQEKPALHPPCTLPKVMTCVGATGSLYTCGLVVGNEKYRLGHAGKDRLDHVMSDESLPHVIPEGSIRTNRGFDGCPPLVLRQLHKAKETADKSS